MKERGLIFSGPMVRANLEGRKTQTRRMRGLNEINENPDAYGGPEVNRLGVWTFWCPDFGEYTHKLVKCPYGVVGDRFYMRENLLLKREKDTPYFDVLYCADNTHFDNGHELDDWFMGYAGWYDSGKSKRIIPCIHMPEYAARPERFEITDIRVERVQDISDSDAIAEGIPDYPNFKGDCPVDDFRELWDSIYVKRGYGWEINPWVFPISYRKLRDNE